MTAAERNRLRRLIDKARRRLVPPPPDPEQVKEAEYRKDYRARKRAARGLPPSQSGYCKKGLHKLTADNMAPDYKGGKRCRACQRARQLEYQRKRAAVRKGGSGGG